MRDQSKLLGAKRKRWKYHLAWIVMIFLLLMCQREWETFRPVAEFETQESTMVCWSRHNADMITALIEQVSQKDRVEIYYNERWQSPQQIGARLFASRARLDHVAMIPFRLEDENVWIRDYGPTLVPAESGMVSIGFGYPHEFYQDYSEFSSQLANRLRIPFLNTGIRSTGGGRQINGRGTMLLVEGYERAINPGLSLRAIEKSYKDKFQQQKVIWLKRGIPQDDLPHSGPLIEKIYGTGTQGHLDEFCRFVDSAVILLAAVDSQDLVRDPFYSLIHERLEENYQILKEASDQHGQPFHIKRLPVAPVVYVQGKIEQDSVLFTPVTSYMNFVITNHYIVMPSYYAPGEPDFVKQKDEEAQQILRDIFPSREVVPLPALELNYKGGGWHCITLEKPKVDKLQRGRKIG